MSELMLEDHYLTDTTIRRLPHGLILGHRGLAKAYLCVFLDESAPP